MSIYEVLPDGREDWHFSHEFDTFSPARAAEMFAEHDDWSSTEFKFIKEGGVVQVRKKGGGQIARFSVTGETVPKYYAKMLHSTPRPTP